MHPYQTLSKYETPLMSFIQSNQIPTYRQAYSDRTAWLMAKLSAIAYYPLHEKTTKATLEQTLDVHMERVYDREDTQAFLASFCMGTTRYLVLVFRGTEDNRLKDIKTDITADKIDCPSNGKIHKGFSHAYDQVAAQIQTDLNKTKYASLPLFITCHSLGGALATIATKRLTHKGGIAACYNFGAPRVGDSIWSYEMKSPIYRVVNAMDCVTMLPPAKLNVILEKILYGMLYLLVKLVATAQYIPFMPKDFTPKLISVLESLSLAQIFNYKHSGDMRYLTDCKPGQYEDVKLTFATRLNARVILCMLWKDTATAGRFLSDHAIDIYCKKLTIIANRRNNIT